MRELEREFEDVEMEDAEEGGDEDVEMDDEEAPRLIKRTKGNSGAVVAAEGGKRVPRSNRAMAGLRDSEEVRPFLPF